MLLYLVKHSIFGNADSLRELSKVADKAKIEHWNLLIRCINYIIASKYLALKLKRNAIGPTFEKKGIKVKVGRAELKVPAGRNNIGTC
jgi:hypothetical protein